MTTLARSLALTTSNPAPTLTIDTNVVSLPGMLALPPVTFFNATQGQRDTLPQMTGMTVMNLDTVMMETWNSATWGKHALFSAMPNSGDALAFNPLTALFDPTPVNRPLLSQLRVYNDATDIVEVKRVYSGNTLTNTSGLTTATMTPAGEHTLTGGTNKTYRVTVDSAGTLPWDEATVKWSNDSGATWQASGVTVATGGAAGRKVLAPILLDNGVSIMFTAGQLSNADYWTFTAIASGNQLYDLKVDTTNSITKVGTRLIIANDSNFSLYKPGSNPVLYLDESANAYVNYAPGSSDVNVAVSATLMQLHHSATATERYAYFPETLVLLPIATPTTGAFPKFYAKTGDKPYWLDSGGVESIIPQAAKAETITGAWTLKAPAIQDSLGTPRITIATASPHVSIAGDLTLTTVGSSLSAYIIGGTAAQFTTSLNCPLYLDTATDTRITIGTASPHVMLTGDANVSGYWRVGSAAAPSNTTAGDLTAIRALVGTNAAFPAGGALLWVNQATLGNEVVRLTSTATNDDPVRRTYQNRVATTDATQTTIHTIAIDSGKVVWIDAWVLARRTGGAAGAADDSAGYKRIAIVRDVAGTATIINAVSAPVSMEVVAAYDVTITVTGATALLRVTGVASTNITWHCTVDVYDMST